MKFPERIGRYHILGLLATGGMAEILLGKLLGPGGFERAVVIKRALPHLARQREFRDMFLDEARVVSRIRHPNVVHVTELGEEDDDLFMVMEYLAGESVAGLLRRLITREEQLPVEVALFIACEALAGLHAAHEVSDEGGRTLALVHRDVSPHNLFVAYDGRVKLLDFGIAKFHDRSVNTSTGHLKGKFAYMSPEQCLDEPVDRRSDVFSAGIVLWELLTGARLFKRANELLCWKAIVEDATRPLEPWGSHPLPEGLEPLVMTALEKKVVDRPASAEDLRRALQSILRRVDPQEKARGRLVSIMERVFEDRIEQKRELLRRVRSGAEVTSVPSAEVDVDGPSARTVTATREAIRPTLQGTTPPSVLPKRPTWMLGSLLIALLAASGLGLLWAADGAVAPAQVEPVAMAVSSGEPLVDRAVSSGDPATAAPAAPSRVPAPAQVPEAAAPTVTVQLETVPPGAAVSDEAGAALGVTPCTFEVPAGDVPRTLRVSLSGYDEHVETLVPDVHQRVRVSLTRARRRARRRPPANTASPDETPPSDFFRFD